MLASVSKPVVHSVLVRTKNAANIGSAARATANLSANGKLILVGARTSLNSSSRKMAAGAQEILDQHEAYDTWEDLLTAHPTGIRLGLSRRGGKQRKPLSLPDSLHRTLSVPEHHSAHIYLVFGPEEDGLSTNDLEHCHMTCFLPAYGSFKSLNLAQAVLLAHYVTQQNLEQLIFKKDGYALGTLPQFEQLKQHGSPLFPEQDFKEFLKRALPQAHDQSLSNSYETLRRMILRATPTHKELELFALTIKNCLDLKTRCSDDTTSAGSKTE